MNPNTNAAGVSYVSNKNPSGTSFGQSATDKVSLYGVTPIVQQTACTAATSAVTTTDFNLMRTALINIGVWA